MLPRLRKAGQAVQSAEAFIGFPVRVLRNLDIEFAAGEGFTAGVIVCRVLHFVLDIL